MAKRQTTATSFILQINKKAYIGYSY